MNKKSNEIPEQIDYRKLPKDVEQAIEPTPEIISEEAKIGFDGRQYFIRFPTEISKLFSITTNDKVKFILTRPHPKSNEKTKLDIELIKK